MTQKISLASQIAEVERELEWRRKNYPGRVSSRAMRDAEADLYLTHLEAALASLRWLQKNRARQKEETAERQESATRHPSEAQNVVSLRDRRSSKRNYGR
jgi:hypothetical protein